MLCHYCGNERKQFVRMELPLAYCGNEVLMWSKVPVCLYCFKGMLDSLEEEDEHSKITFRQVPG